MLNVTGGYRLLNYLSGVRWQLASCLRNADRKQPATLAAEQQASVMGLSRRRTVKICTATPQFTLSA